MRVLVTGATGFIGGHIGDRLASEAVAVDVTGVDVRPPLSAAPPRFPIEVKPYREIIPRVSAGEFDAVVHQAAITDTLVDASPKLADVNVQGVRDLATACARSGTQLVFASSASIYGAIASDHVAKVGDEREATLCTGPLNPYGASKMAAEYLLESVDGLKSIAFRYTNVFGSGEGSKGRMACVLTQMAQQAAAGAEVNLFNDTLNASRDFVPVSRVVDVVTRAVMDSRSARYKRVYNLGSGTNIRFSEIVEWLCTIAPKNQVRLNLVPNVVASRYQYRTNVYTEDLESAFGLSSLSRSDIFSSAESLVQNLVDSER